MWGDHMISHGNKAKKEERRWGTTKFEKEREVINTGNLRVGNPLPTMRSGCREIFFY